MTTLLSITKKALGAAPKRLQRMLLRLQRYNFDLQWVPISDLVLADTMSRSVGTDTANLNVDTSDAVDEVSALTGDGEQLSDLQMVASQQTINEIRAATADDDIPETESTHNRRLAKLQNRHDTGSSCCTHICRRISRLWWLCFQGSPSRDTDWLQRENIGALTL